MPYRCPECGQARFFFARVLSEETVVTDQKGFKAWGLPDSVRVLPLDPPYGCAVCNFKQDEIEPDQIAAVAVKDTELVFTSFLRQKDGSLLIPVCGDCLKILIDENPTIGEVFGEFFPPSSAKCDCCGELAEVFYLLYPSTFEERE